MVQHPIQPLEKDDQGMVHFKENKIVKFLLDAGLYNMSQLSMMPFSDEDRSQFAQLIGYDLFGFGELKYVSDETYEKLFEKKR